VLVKSGTISSSPECFPITPMKFSVSPVVRQAVSLVNVADAPKFIKGLFKLKNSDPCLQVLTEESGQSIIAGAGELHIETALADLREFFGDIKFTVSPPVVKFNETVLAASTQTCLAKSPNKLNRLYVTAEPLSEKLVTDLDSKKLRLDNPKELYFTLTKEYGWEKNDASKLWWMEDTCCLVDMTHSLPYLASVKDHIVAAVKSATAEGVLGGEPMRGVRFNIVDAVLHSDSLHRSVAQILPAAKRAFFAALLCASPALVEPVFLAEIQAEQKVLSKIYSLLSKKRGNIIEELSKEGSTFYTVRAHIPVLESLGFDAALRQETSGHASPQLVFSHWQSLPGNPYEEGTLAGKELTKLRERKRLKDKLPVLSDYNDKL